MSKIEINKLTNANVYMNGVNLLGRAEEVQLPQIKHKMAEHKALGMVGSAEFFAGIDKMECKIKWNALYPAVMAVCSNPFLATMIQVRANLETYNGTGRIKEVPATAFLIGTFKEFPLGNIKPQENAEYETTMSVTYAKLVVDGVEIFEIDVLENIYKVGMVDMLSTFKKEYGGLMTEETILKKANSKKGLTEEIATRKRALNFYSLANILPDPDIVLRKQGKDIRIYKELLCDPHVFACIQSRKAGVLSLDWEINRGLDKDKNAEEIEELLKKLNIHKLISDILDATSYGYQPLEIIWKKSSSGHVLPAKIIAKPPEWFCFDDDNNLKFRTKDNYYGEIVPDKKFLLAQNNPSYNNPYGERTLSRVFWSVTFKKGGLKFWVVFTEKYGMPHLIGKHPRGASKDETNTLADMLEDMVQDAIAVIPDDSSVEIQEANKSSSAEIYEKLIDKMNAEISKAILGQTLTTEIGSTGSYAASNTHFAIRQDIVDADRKLVESVINQLIQWIYEINFADCRQSAKRSGDTFNADNQEPNQEVPVFEMYEPEDVDLTLAQRDKILSETGVKFTKEYFIKAYGLEEEDFDIREDIIPATNSQFSEFKEDASGPGQEQIEDLYKFISDNKLSEQAQKMISPLIALIDGCEDFNEAYELLTDKNLHSKQFEQTLQKALFLCELQGRSDGLE